MQSSDITGKLNRLFELRQARLQVEAKSKALKKEIDDLEFELIDEFKEAGQDQVRTDKTTASYNCVTVGSIRDSEQFGKWARRKNALYFFEQRIAQKALRELLATNGGKPPPGVELYNRESILTPKRRAAKNAPRT